MSSPPPKGKSTSAASDIGSVSGQRPASFSAAGSSSSTAGLLQASPLAKRIAGLNSSSGLLGMALKAAQSECPSSVASAEAAADGLVVIPKAGSLRHLTPHQKCK